ncbi:MAG: carbonic anhydrase [Aquabacterium sp.]
MAIWFNHLSDAVPGLRPLATTALAWALISGGAPLWAQSPAATPSAAAAAGAASITPARPAVSMSELRDLIEQRISEVRAQRGTAPPVVQVKSSRPTQSGRTSKRPAATASASAALAAVAQADERPVAPGKTSPLGREVGWAYQGDTGPDQWGLLKPEYRACVVGRRQSPIDLRDGIPVTLDPLQFEYRPSLVTVLHRDHTVVIEPEPGNAVSLRGRRYELQHIALRHPGEVHVAGRQSPMSLQLLHRAADGELLMVAVPVMLSTQEHPVMGQIWSTLPLERHLQQRSTSPIDLSRLLPAEPAYFLYMGSLTTPPCTEDVIWAVMKQPLGISGDQMAVMARLYPNNARPVQPTHGRLVKDGQ